MQRPEKLSSRFVRSVTEPGRYTDGRGGFSLSILVKARKDGGISKTWSQRCRINGRPTNIGLGAYPAVTLARARERALENPRAVADGFDPRNLPSEVPTFKQAAEEVIAFHRPGWKTGNQEARIWRSTFRLHLPRAFLNRHVDEISPADGLGVLQPLWHTKMETARRLRQRIAAVMKWSMAKGHVLNNPAGEAIQYALPRQRKSANRHFRALPCKHVARAIATVLASRASPVTKLCFEFLVLTAARWSDIDFEAAAWAIPAERMKAGREHRVPLSDRAITILREAWELHDGSGRIFPSPTGKVLSDMALSKLIKELGIPAVPHGFRSSFRDFGAECTDAPHAVMETALAHKVGSAVEQAYARSDLFEKRRKLMEQCADYLTA